ncbi:hypothetical protein ASF27_05930 [Methylobacterium sp. Leaf102]|nr:hypothetical protein ASF27_05930 [Methylobacterium sp. Leaf102]
MADSKHIGTMRTTASGNVQNQGEQGQRVDGVAEHRHGGERADERHRDREQRNDGGAHVLQEDDDHEDDEGDGFVGRHFERLDRRAYEELGRIVGHSEFDARGPIALQRRHRGLDRFGALERVRARALEDEQGDGGRVVDVGVGAVLPCAEFGAADIPQPDDAAAAGVADDEILEFLRLPEPALHGDRGLERPAGGRGRLREHAAGDLDVLRAERVHDLHRGHAHLRDLVRIKPYPHGVFARAHRLNAADGGQPAQHRHDALKRIVRQIELIPAPIGRNELHDEQEVGGVLRHGHADAADDLREAWLGEGHPVLHQELRLIEIGADAERHGVAEAAVLRRLRLHASDACG